MKRIHWLILAIAGLGVIVFGYIAIPRYVQKDSMRSVSNNTLVQIMSDTVSPTNTHFLSNNLSVKSVVYISDGVAVASLRAAKEGVTIYAVFELKDNKIYLTNYSSSRFSISDFSQTSDVTTRIINAVNGL